MREGAQPERPALCAAIRGARLRAGFTQREAAAQLGLSESAYRLYERRVEPKPARLRQIALLYGLREDHFLAGDTPILSRLDELVSGQRQILSLLHRLTGAPVEDAEPVQLDEPRPDPR